MFLENYTNNINMLKSLLENHKTEEGTYLIGELKLIFDYDDEGFYEKNSLSVYDYFSKRVLTYYYINREYNGVRLFPFMDMNGCNSLIPDIVGSIDMESSFDKLISYVKQNKNKIELYYNNLTQRYEGIEYSEKIRDLFLTIDPMNFLSVAKVKSSNLHIEFSDFNVEYKDEDYRFTIGTNIYDYFKITKEDFESNEFNELFYPNLRIRFTNWEQIKEEFEKINNCIIK